MTEFTPPRTRGSLRYALGFLTQVETQRDPGWATGPVRLSGHARVLAVEPDPDGGRPPCVLATPLYVQYAERG